MKRSTNLLCRPTYGMAYCKVFLFLNVLTYVTLVGAGIWRRCLLCGDFLILIGNCVEKL